MNPFSAQRNVINTGKDGQLDTTTTAEIDAMITEIGKAGKAVWHFHGGLVPKHDGMAGAERLFKDCYSPTGAYPVFFVWESGLMESVTHNWQEIFDEEFFKRLLSWLLKFAVGKVTQGDGAKATGVELPKEVQHQTELKKTEPYDAIASTELVPDVTEIEASQLESAVAKDEALKIELRNILDTTLTDVEEQKGAKGITLTQRKSTKTLISPERLEELHAGFEKADPTAKGALSLAALTKVAKAAVVILKRVVSRFQKGRDHGLYTTVVEEIMREYYVANIGTKVWSIMKKETEDSFQSVPGQIRAGNYFLTKFGELLKSGVRPKITLVGHSTGAVFINNLLSSFAQRRTAEGWPMDFQFHQICFLAPACRMDHFASTATVNRALFQGFRMFTMLDEKESKDRLLGPVYPRSLLYAISGLLETEEPTSGDSGL